MKIANHLAANIESEKLESGKNLFINFYPDDPDMVVSVIDLGGHPPALYVPIREKVIEIKFRALDSSQGETLGTEIMNLLHDKENYYLEGLRVLHSYARTDSNYLYADSKSRDEFSMELVFLIQR